jgi:frataxin-like iron-binding protein CyaY
MSTSLLIPDPPTPPKRLIKVVGGIAAYALCDDGKIRKVRLQQGQARKLHNFVKHNLCGGVMKLSFESCQIVADQQPPCPGFWFRLRQKLSGFRFPNLKSAI